MQRMRLSGRGKSPPSAPEKAIIAEGSACTRPLCIWHRPPLREFYCAPVYEFLPPDRLPSYSLLFFGLLSVLFRAVFRFFFLSSRFSCPFFSRAALSSPFRCRFWTKD